MKIRYIFVTLVVNIFVLMAVTVIQEYMSVKDTFSRMNSTLQLAIDTGVSASMASEEFFSDEFPTALASKSNSYKDSDRYLYSTLTYMRGNEWVSGNSYFLSQYYSENGNLPITQYEYDIYAEHKDISDVFGFIFGTGGSDYDSPELTWANQWQTSPYVIDATRRIPTSEFKQFYEAVGKRIISSQFVKVSDGSGSWTLEEMELPVLLQMGLKLDATDYGLILDNVSQNVYWNAAGLGVTADNYSSVEKYGRLVDNGMSIEDSIYYLTPYSLGVTYVPTPVLKTNIRVNLENIIRFSKCKLSPLSSTFHDMNAVYMSAEGCIDTSVYDDGVGGATANSQEHRVGTLEQIFNDGEAEYDMNSLQVKVDYFLVDFYDDSNWRIVNEIEGATPYDASLLQTLPSRLKDTDTLASGANSGNRIVAKITTKIKVNVPYKSPVLQWFVHRSSTNAVEHFGVARWNDATGTIEDTADGLWYAYSTYTAISR